MPEKGRSNYTVTAILNVCPVQRKRRLLASLFTRICLLLSISFSFVILCEHLSLDVLGRHQLICVCSLAVTVLVTLRVFLIHTAGLILSLELKL